MALSQTEREALENEWRELQVKLKGEFVNPKDVRRCDEITSLLMTDGENANIKFGFGRPQKSRVGLSSKKGYRTRGGGKVGL